MITHIFESHAHFDDERYDADRDSLIASLSEKGIEAVINISSGMDSALATVKLCEKYPFFYGAVGVHPHEIDWLEIDTLREYAKNEKIVAIGEIGLDYHYDGYDREKQISAFEKQLELAKELDKPVIIHSRDATQDTLEILRKYNPKGVVHCFSGSAETAKEIVNLGMYLGFTGVITFKNAKRAIEALSVTPLDRILCETDCPYMAPEPHRGERNDSTMLCYILEKMAQVKGVTPQQMADITFDNAKKLFLK